MVKKRIICCIPDLSSEMLFNKNNINFIVKNSVTISVALFLWKITTLRNL